MGAPRTFYEREGIVLSDRKVAQKDLWITFNSRTNTYQLFKEKANGQMIILGHYDFDGKEKGYRKYIRHKTRKKRKYTKKNTKYWKSI